MEEWRFRSIGSLFQQEVRPSRPYATRCIIATRGEASSQATSIEVKTRQQPYPTNIWAPFICKEEG